jgi:hypothetical protein
MTRRDGRVGTLAVGGDFPVDMSTSDPAMVAAAPAPVMSKAITSHSGTGAAVVNDRPQRHSTTRPRYDNSGRYARPTEF